LLQDMSLFACNSATPFSEHFVHFPAGLKARRDRQRPVAANGKLVRARVRQFEIRENMNLSPREPSLRPVPLTTEIKAANAPPLLFPREKENHEEAVKGNEMKKKKKVQTSFQFGSKIFG